MMSHSLFTTIVSCTHPTRSTDTRQACRAAHCRRKSRLTLPADPTTITSIGAPVLSPDFDPKEVDSHASTSGVIDPFLAAYLRRAPHSGERVQAAAPTARPLFAQAEARHRAPV